MRCSRCWVSVSILPRPSASAWAIGVSPTISRIALSAADFLVAGQHQRLFRQVAPAPRRRAFAGAIADLGAVDPGDARPQHALDRRRQMVVEAGLGGSVVGAETQHDA